MCTKTRDKISKPYQFTTEFNRFEHKSLAALKPIAYSTNLTDVLN